jgi:hypothetical protein
MHFLTACTIERMVRCSPPSKHADASIRSSKPELTTIDVLEYDLRNTPEQHFLYQKAFGPNPAFFVAPLTLTMRLTVTRLHVELRLKNQVLCERYIDVTATNDEERN